MLLVACNIGNVNMCALFGIMARLIAEADAQIFSRSHMPSQQRSVGRRTHPSGRPSFDLLAIEKVFDKSSTRIMGNEGDKHICHWRNKLQAGRISQFVTSAFDVSVRPTLMLHSRSKLKSSGSEESVKTSVVASSIGSLGEREALSDQNIVTKGKA